MLEQLVPLGHTPGPFEVIRPTGSRPRTNYRTGHSSMLCTSCQFESRTKRNILSLLVCSREKPNPRALVCACCYR